MPETLTPVSQYNNTNPTIAEPGDIGGMQTGPAPMKPVLQKVFDRVAFALLAVSGALVWSEELSVESVVSSSNFAVRIGAIQSVVIAAADGATYDVFFYAGGTIGASKIEGTPGSLDADSWYYVYAIPGASPGAACDFEISLTAPRANRVFKTGSGFAYQSRRYLGCFRTDGAGSPIYMSAARGHCRWLTAPAARAALSTGSAIAATSVACAAYAPPHARMLCVTTLATETGAAPATYSLYETTTAAAQAFHQVPASQSTTNGAELICTSAQAIAYLCSTVDVDLTIYVDGWRE